MAFALVALTLGVSACRAKKEEASAAPKGSARPLDHLPPGVLAEGTEKAFALTLPRDFEVARRFPGVVAATSRRATPEQSANYIRERVRDGAIAAGASGTRFTDVHVPAEDKRKLLIEVTARSTGGTSIVIRDVTPAVVDPNLTQEERWKKAGLTPQGKPLDPQHME